MLLSVLATITAAQFTPGGETEPGLPAGCVGSYPDIQKCQANNWHISTSDPCAPTGAIPMAGQQVYIKDELNFCINLPNPNSIFLKNNFYSQNKLPTIVQAEGYIQSFCMGDYLPPGSLKMPPFAIRSAHVVKNFVTPGSMYMQIHGTLDCTVLNINCTQSFPGAYDDGGQYDNVPYESCGKEPYSGVDSSGSGNAGFSNYVEQAGDGEFCMRVCQPGTSDVGGPCDPRHDTAGCTSFMGVTFTDGFSYTDMANPAVVSNVAVSLPPPATATPTATMNPSGNATNGATGPAGGAGGSGAGGSPAATNAHNAGVQISLSLLCFAVGVLLI